MALQGQQQLAATSPEHNRIPSGRMLRGRARVQWREQLAAPRQLMEGVSANNPSFSPPPPAPPLAIPSSLTPNSSHPRPAADACVFDQRQSPAPLQHGVHRRRRQQRPVVCRAILAEQQQEQQPEAAASEPDADQHSKASPCPTITGPLLHGFIEAWICIRQARPGGPAEVFEYSRPMNDVLWEKLQQGQVQPIKLVTVHQLSFCSCANVRGAWANFRVRVSRGFSPFEHSTMFPNRVQLLGAQSHTANTATADAFSTFNSSSSSSSSRSSSSRLSEALKQAQVVEVVAPASSSPKPSMVAPSVPAGQAIAQDMPAVHSHCPNNGTSSGGSSCSHSNESVGMPSISSSSSVDTSSSSCGALQVQRRCHNARDLSDLVQLLADPTETGILAHLANAGRVFSYRPRRIWDCLKARWGNEALHSLGFTPRSVHRLLQQGTIYDLVWQDQLLVTNHYMEGGSSSSSSSGSDSVHGGAQQQWQEAQHSAAQQLEEVRAANQRASLILQAAAAQSEQPRWVRV